MYILQIATELAPVAKVGGLGDVLYGLSKELVKKGHEVDILLPKYDVIDYKMLRDLKIELRDIPCKVAGKIVHNTLWSCELDNLRLLLLESHHPDKYFEREKIYGCADDPERFTYFSKAALEMLAKWSSVPDIVHIHDWPTALIAPLYKESFADRVKVGGIVLTIHNLEYQGKCAPEQIEKLGLSPDNPHLEDPYLAETINLLRGGIEYADAVTTVSPTYEQEILTEHEGMGLDLVLQAHRQKFYGILNGIDEDYWNPETDPFLAKRFKTRGAFSLEEVHKAKKENRKQIALHFNLKEEEVPLVASITRLVPQKGPELLLHGLQRTLERGGQFVLLGSNHQMPIEDLFLEWNGQNGRVGISIARDEALSHLLFAAADMLLIPSRFEPCGLTQLIALRYGTVPLARRTGGLADTIFDVDTADVPPQKRNGFTFDHFDQEGANWALERALTYWQNDRAKWDELMLNGMRMDFSWKEPSEKHLELYRKLLLKRARAA